MIARRGRLGRAVRRRQRGQALVETALVIPLLLLVGFGVLGAGRVARAQMGVIATAREAARAGALATSAPEAAARGAAHGQSVAAGYGLANGTLAVVVDASGFGRGGQVRAETRYTVTLEALPLLGWARLPLASSHVELVDRYRSLPAQVGGSR